MVQNPHQGNKPPRSDLLYKDILCKNTNTLLTDTLHDAQRFYDRLGCNKCSANMVREPVEEGNGMGEVEGDGDHAVCEDDEGGENEVCECAVCECAVCDNVPEIYCVRCEYSIYERQSAYLLHSRWSVCRTKYQHQDQ